MKKTILILLVIFVFLLSGCKKEEINNPVKKKVEKKKVINNITLSSIEGDDNIYFKVDFDNKKLEYNGNVDGIFHSNKTRDVNQTFLNEVKAFIDKYDAYDMDLNSSCSSSNKYVYSILYNSDVSKRYTYCVNGNKKDNNYIFFSELNAYLKFMVRW